MVRRNFVILFFLLLLFILYLFRYYNAPEFLSYHFVLVSLCLNLLSLTFFLLKKEYLVKLRSQYLTIFNLFIISFCIVQFQIYTEYVINPTNFVLFNYFIDSTIIPKAATISSIAFISFLFGNLFRTSIPSFNRIEGKGRTIPVFLHNDVLFYLITIFFFGFLASTDPAYFFSGYGSVAISSLSSYFQQFLIYSIIGYYLVNLFNWSNFNYITNRRYRNIYLNILILLYLGLVLLSGDRGPIIQISSVIILYYIIIYNYSISSPKLLFFIVVSVLVFNFLGIVRTVDFSYDLSSWLSQAIIKKSNLSSSLATFPPTMELAIVVRTFHASVLFSDSNGYFYGLIQLYQIIGSIPGLGQLVKMVSSFDFDSLKSSYILTEQLGGDHGLGTTSVADVYLDFGVFGLIPIFGMFGYFVRVLDEFIFSKAYSSLFLLVLSVVFFSFSIYIARSSILIVFRHCFFVYLFIYFSQYTAGFFRNQK